jgi:hypothetical protein
MDAPPAGAGASTLRFDHAVVAVDSLAEAADAWRAAGFVVTPGGRHDAVPTENALVAFADGAYLELLAFRDPATRDELRALARTARWERHLQGVSAVARRFLPALTGPAGVADVALARRGLARFAAESRRRGVPMTGPVPMRRKRPDGVALVWDLLLPADPALPFFIEDRTDRALRVPGDAAATSHPNGARGIAGIRVRTPSVTATALAWTDLLGASPRAMPGGVTRLAVAGIEVELIEGASAGASGVAVKGVGALPARVAGAGVVPAE